MSIIFDYQGLLKSQKNRLLKMVRDEGFDPFTSDSLPRYQGSLSAANLTTVVPITYPPARGPDSRRSIFQNREDYNGNDSHICPHLPTKGFKKTLCYELLCVVLTESSLYRGNIPEDSSSPLLPRILWAAPNCSSIFLAQATPSFSGTHIFIASVAKSISTVPPCFSTMDRMR